ncbi:hypothetical protein V1478_014911 [Vespula squamosa]|uniref:Uncharacterized protein n=1 Tax=Vespula squamosa TaxID=30214 RepID=A0ABD2A3M1_VESSQ
MILYWNLIYNVFEKFYKFRLYVLQTNIHIEYCNFHKGHNLKTDLLILVDMRDKQARSVEILETCDTHLVL